MNLNELFANKPHLLKLLPNHVVANEKPERTKAGIARAVNEGKKLG
ncbi:hypothetical protein ACFLU1_03305 [Chloroflexota bacterium]